MAVPAVRTLALVRESSRLQYNDYWPMIDGVMGPGGRLNVGALFELRNEHPIAVPKFGYWLNARLFDGSNVTLGVIVVGVVLVTVGCLAALAARTAGLRRGHVAALAVACAFLLLSPRGSWYFVKSMSGAAWLTANLFVVAAVLAQARRHRFLAVGLALGASFSYGTGLAVWPALLVVGALGDRSIRRQWPTALAAAGALGWYYGQYRQIPDNPWMVTPSLPSRADTGLTTLGAFFRPADDNWTTALGVVLVLAGLVASALVCRRAWTAGAGPDDGDDGGAGDDGDASDHRGALGWVALYLVAVVATALLSGTPRVFVSVTESRYSVFGAMLAVSLLGLVFTLVASGRPTTGGSERPWGPVILVVATLAALVVGWRGGEVRSELRETRRMQDELAIAMHLDLAGGSTYWQAGWETFPDDIEEQARATGQVPFDGRDRPGCGLIGSVLPESVLDRDDPLPGAFEAEFLPGVEWTTQVIGDIGAEVDCIVVTADTSRVRGAGFTGSAAQGYVGGPRPAPAGHVRFVAISHASDVVNVWARVAGEDTFRPVGTPAGP